MGQVHKQKKKYYKPSHPWQKERIVIEKQLKREYGLVNKKELWKAGSYIKKARYQAKKITANKLNPQAQKEKEQLLNKLKKYDLIKNDSPIDDVLELNIKHVLNKRLQTIVYKKNLSNTIKQSRQFIVHGHIYLDNKKVASPSFLVPKHLENKISFRPNSSLSKLDHPERAIKVKQDLEKRKKEEIIKQETKQLESFDDKINIKSEEVVLEND